MENLPAYVKIVFILTTIFTIALFYWASNKSKTTLFILIACLVFQTLLGNSEFYLQTNTFPPRFLLLVIPQLLLIVGMFSTKAGRNYIDKMDVKILTILHIIRIPIEVVLFWLFIHKGIPKLMTFEGRNFDIISGLSSPILFYFGFVKSSLSKNVILIWNFICLGLLINIVSNAILSAPFPFQKFAFDQPNIAILYFPFNWLPSCVVPIVLFSHLAAIRQLYFKSN